MKKVKFLGIGLLSLTLVFSSCEAIKNSSNTAKGAAVGTAGGAAVGAGVGAMAGNTALGAIIGAAVGGGAGALIGNKMDKQAKELEQINGAEVERVGEGIKVTFESGLLFATGKSDLNAASKKSLTDFAVSLKSNPDTEVLIEGHTDSSGNDAINQPLSERRAEAVSSYLVSQGISSNRLITKGYGSSQPIADNETTAGKAKNRRVEIAIYANQAMIDAAKAGNLK